MRILYVEDNQANVYLVRRVALGHEVINYIDGEQTLENIETLNPDLILMDIQLAGPLSGLDVVREIRARGVNTTIIAVTAYAMVGDREKCLAAGCDDYMAKPLPIARLVSVIKEHSQRVEAGRAETQEVARDEVITTDDDADSQTDAETSDDTSPDAAIADIGKIESPASDIADEALIIDVDEDTAKTD